MAVANLAEVVKPGISGEEMYDAILATPQLCHIAFGNRQDQQGQANVSPIFLVLGWTRRRETPEAKA
jgi:hypothetical protein